MDTYLGILGKRFSGQTFILAPNLYSATLVPTLPSNWPKQMHIGIRGWGSTHSLVVDFAIDWFNANTGPRGEFKVTAYVEDNKVSSSLPKIAWRSS
jgi:hypothetical protein